jgi:hypothetical protein
MSKIFISHSSKDKKFARKLAKSLSVFGFPPWLDELEIHVGDSIVQKVQQGLEDCDFMVLVLSKNSVKSKWVENEWQTKYWEEIETKKIKVLPALTERCRIPKLLLIKKYADFRTSYEKGLLELVHTISHPQGLGGITKYYPDFVDIADDWLHLLNNTTNVDLLCMYSETWRNTYLKYLKEIVTIKKGRIRIILPNFYNNELSKLYSKRLSCSAKDLKDKIQIALRDFHEIDKGSHVSIHLVELYFNHAYYLFDYSCIFALYSYELGRVSTPAMLLEEGEFMQFLKKDFNYLIKNKKLSKKIL